jgi:glutathione S-transferase
MTEDFLKLNPQHTIPVLVDEGNGIWDSHAINVYLVEKYGQNDVLYPKDHLIRAKINAALHFESGVLFARTRFLIVSSILPESKP